MQMKDIIALNAKWTEHRRTVKDHNGNFWQIAVSTTLDAIRIGFEESYWFLSVKKTADTTHDNILDTTELYFKTETQAYNLEEMLKHTGMIE